MRHWLLAGCLGLLATLTFASGCGDDEGEESGGEKCFQAGGLDFSCRCSPDQPTGSRRCQDNLVWSACVCGEPRNEPCERGDLVECRCPGDSRTYTTECLGGGTFDCPCSGDGASGNGD